MAPASYFLSSSTSSKWKLPKGLQHSPPSAVSGFGALPHLAFILVGQVTLMPEAESSSVQNGRLKTVVPVVPDAPIGPLPLHPLRRLGGLALKPKSLCSAPTISRVEFSAQKGKKQARR